MSLIMWTIMCTRGKILKKVIFTYKSKKMNSNRQVAIVVILCCFSLFQTSQGNGNDRCSAKANVILLIPGNGNNETVHAWFEPMEHFLHGIVNYLDISEKSFNVGFMLYGRSPKAMSEIRPFRNRTQINTRLSLLSHQGDLSWILTGSPSLPLALIELRNMFKRAELERVETGENEHFHNIAILILNGTEKYHGEWRVLQLAKEAKEMGITLYTVTMGKENENPGLARKIASDDCKNYFVGNGKVSGPFSSEEVLKDIGNNICSATNPNMADLAGPDLLKNCYLVREIEPPPVVPSIECHSNDSVHPDDNNCAYFFKCEDGKPNHLRCRLDNLFDPLSMTCNHKEAVTCFSQVTCPEPTGLFPYPGTCTKYLNCFNGLTYIQSCPYTLHFDQKSKRCVRPKESDCPFSNFKIPILHQTFFR